MEYKVWIDQDLCTGDGICVDDCAPIFAMHDDGLAYVKEVAWKDIYNGEGGEPKLQMAEGMASVPESLLEDVILAAEDCPGDCIFIEVIED